MGITIGPVDWWIATPEAIDSLAISCPEATTLPDGSRIICKSGGKAWIVAPCTTQVASNWAGGQYNTTLVGDKCCICEWSGLETELINYGFNPIEWFVPSASQLQNPGYVCRTNWDFFSLCNYWSSTEVTASLALCVNFNTGAPASAFSKTGNYRVRAMRCVNY